MMSKVERAQCLLFAAITDRKPGSTSTSSCSSTNFLFKAYAVLPQSFTDAHPGVVEKFSRNDIRVLSNVQVDSSLQTAVKNGTKFEIFELQVIAKSPESEDVSPDAPSPLRVLVDEFNKQAVELLFSRNVDISCLSVKYQTGYISVDSNHDLKAMGDLLLYGKNIVYQQHFGGGTILHFAVKRDMKNLVKLLLQHEADVNAKRLDGMTPLHIAAMEGQVEIGRTLLKHGADVNASIAVEDRRARTPLALAHRYGHREVVASLLESGADVNVEFDRCLKPLMFCFSDSEEQANRTIKPISLYTAVVMRDFQSLKSVLCHQPDLDNEYNKRAFHYVLIQLEYDFKGIFKQMKEYGFMIDYGRIENSMKFLVGAIHKNCFEVVQKIVEAGVNVNEAYEHQSVKFLPLHMAASSAGENVVQLLLDHGADINAKVKYESPVHCAIKSNNISALKCLIANKTHILYNAELILRAAIAGGSEVIEFLLLNGYPLISKKEYIAALSQAAYIGHMEVINVLLKYGAHLSSECMDYKGPLHSAIMGGPPEIFQSIFEYSFFNVQFINHPEIIRGLEQDILSRSFRHPARYELYSNILVQQILKLETAFLCAFDQNITSLWHANESIDDFRTRCEREIAQLKTERVGDSEVSFYDILTQDLSHLVGFAKNDSFVKAMKDGDLNVKFPIYSSVLTCQFKKGLLRKELMQQGIKTCKVIFPGKMFYNLPDELKVKIINYLSNCDLLVLNNILPTTAQSER